MKIKKKYRLYQVDAFTRAQFKGNPAGVVLDADGLTEAQMQAIARELNNSETAFVLKSDGPDHDLRIRYFTPQIEVPSCGHATIAAHYVRARLLGLKNQTVRHKIKIGILPAEISEIDGDLQVHVQQGSPEFLQILEGNLRQETLAHLGLQASDLLQGLPIQEVSTGHSKVMIPLRSREQLHGLQPDFSGLSEISRQIGCNGFYVFTLDAQPGSFAHGRMFAPAVGINEDPVTGNASGPLGAYAVRYELAHHNGVTFRFQVKQGEAIGREGTAIVEVAISAGKPVRVKVGGDAVIVFDTELDV